MFIKFAASRTVMFQPGAGRKARGSPSKRRAIYVYIMDPLAHPKGRLWSHIMCLNNNDHQSKRVSL